jgi:hypothetical protein
MPSKSDKQARLMAAAAHNPDFAKKVGVPQSVAKEFNQADTGTKRLSHAMSHASQTHASPTPAHPPVCPNGHCTSKK